MFLNGYTYWQKMGISGLPFFFQMFNNDVFEPLLYTICFLNFRFFHSNALA